MSGVVHHFSEDASIEVFTPHVPRTNPTQRPGVWAIDAEHAPLYWFPRDCPRVTVWPRTTDERAVYTEAFGTTAPRLHVIERRWLDAVATTQLYRYDFDADDFEPWFEASGHWISRTTVHPIGVEPLGPLLELHRTAGIELRTADDLRAVAEFADDERWDFSIVRLANARPTD